MKTAIVILGFDGPGNRVEGNILCIKEFEDNQPVWFGRRVKSPRFQIVVLNNTRIKDLPAAFLEYGYHTSRKFINYSKLENGMATQLRTKDWVGLDALSFRLACDDRGDYWKPDIPEPGPEQP